MNAVAAAGAPAAARSSRRARRRASSSRAFTTRRTSQRMSETAGEPVALDPDTYTSPEIPRDRAAGGRRRDRRRSSASWERRTLRRSRWCGRPATTPSATARWASACSTTSRVGRRARAHAGRRARRHRRLRRPPRQRHAAHVRARPVDPVHLDAPVSRTIRAPARVDEVGIGDGAGFTVNVPLESGAVDADYRVAFDEIVLPVLRQFQPDLLLVSAGFDAHERDPLATMRLTAEAFGAMTMGAAASVAEDVLPGPDGARDRGRLRPAGAGRVARPDRHRRWSRRSPSPCGRPPTVGVDARTHGRRRASSRRSRRSGR